jgi:hypothetical protein
MEERPHGRSPRTALAMCLWVACEVVVTVTIANAVPTHAHEVAAPTAASIGETTPLIGTAALTASTAWNCSGRSQWKSTLTSPP